MWTKNESAPDPVKRPTSDACPEPQAAPALKRPAATGASRAIIGPSMAIKGDISGSEDLVIEGQVEGTVKLRESGVTVGSKGRVTADIQAKQIYVDGEVTGDLVGDEILIRKSGRVNGNARAPRVALENGCTFRGSIDMNPRSNAKEGGSEPRAARDQR